MFVPSANGGGWSSFDAYLEWAADQVCVDCGKRLGDEPKVRGDDGDVIKTWMTETQCMPCYERNGPPENRKPRVVYS